MATSAKINRNTSHDLAVTWVAAEVESEHALRVWFDAGAPQGAAAHIAYSAAGDREDAAARDLQRLSELTQPYQGQLAHSW